MATRDWKVPCTRRLESLRYVVSGGSSYALTFNSRLSTAVPALTLTPEIPGRQPGGRRAKRQQHRQRNQHHLKAAAKTDQLMQGL